MTRSRPASAPSPKTSTDNTRTVPSESTRPDIQPHRSARHMVAKGATGATRLLMRGAVLATIAAVGIAVPLLDGGAEQEPTTVAQPQPARVTATVGPDLLTFLNSEPETQIASSHVAPVVEVSSQYGTLSAQILDDSLLGGCDPSFVPTSSNGNFTDSELCSLPWNDYQLAPAPATSFTAMNEAFKAEFGRDICLVSGYRTFAQQQRLAVTRSAFATRPGTSNHGLGKAVDLCGSETGSREVWNWFHTYGPIYGWENPAWARRGGSGPYEPWHWEYVDASSDDFTAAD